MSSTEGPAVVQAPASPTAFQQALAKLEPSKLKEAKETPPQKEDTPPIVSPKPPQNAEDKFNQKFAALRRQQATFEEQQKDIKDKLARLAKYEAADQSQPESDDKSTPWQTVLEELKSLRAERAQERELSQKRENHQELDNLKRNVARLLHESDDLELSRALSASDQVLDVIGKHYQDTYDDVLRTGEVLSEEQAARLVEQREEEKLRKMLSTKKGQRILRELGPTQELPGLEQSESVPPTLTASSAPQTGPSRDLTLEERRALAIRSLMSKERFTGL